MPDGETEVGRLLGACLNGRRVKERVDQGRWGRLAADRARSGLEDTIEEDAESPATSSSSACAATLLRAHPAIRRQRHRTLAALAGSVAHTAACRP
jgi:hypothetical protein